MAISDKSVDLTEGVLEAVKNGQQMAIEAVRKFVDTVDQSLPLGGNDSSKRQEVIDSALAMADKLVATQYDFLRTVVHAAGGAFNSSADDDKKK